MKLTGRLRAWFPALVVVAALALGVVGAQAGTVVLDPDFGAGGLVTTNIGGGSPDIIYAISQPSSGSGVFYAAGCSGPDVAIARYKRDGSADTYGPGDIGYITTDLGGSNDCAFQMQLVNAAGTGGEPGPLIAGQTNASGNNDMFVAHYRGSGVLDTTYGSGGVTTIDFGGSNDGAYALKVRADGTTFLGGWTNVDGTYDFALARLKATGVVDPNFGTGGMVHTDFGGDEWINALTTDNKGNIIAVGTTNVLGDYDFALARYKPNGTLDPKFGNGGRLVMPMGPGDDSANVIFPTKNNRFFLVGTGTQNGTYDMVVVRIKANGKLDTGFNKPTGKVFIDFGATQDFGNAAMFEPDTNRILVGGSSDADFAMAELDAAKGGFNTGFGTGGRLTTNFGGASSDFANTLTIQPDQKIILAGTSNVNGTFQNALARYKR